MSSRRTTRQRHGAHAEDEAVEWLAAAGWQIVARNVRVGRDEIDVVAVDPAPPRSIVAVEVRSLRTCRFGEPEERVDRRKVTRLYRAMAALRRSEGVGLDASLAWRVDLLIVDRRSGTSVIRHLRSIEPP